MHSKTPDILTNFIHNLNHFLKFIWTDVWTMSKAEVEEDPLAQKILTLAWLVVVVNEREWTSQCWLPQRSCPFFLYGCKGKFSSGVSIQVLSLTNPMFWSHMLHALYVHLTWCNVFAQTTGCLLSSFSFFNSFIPTRRDPPMANVTAKDFHVTGC